MIRQKTCGLKTTGCVTQQWTHFGLISSNYPISTDVNWFICRLNLALWIKMMPHVLMSPADDVPSWWNASPAATSLLECFHEAVRQQFPAGCRKWRWKVLCTPLTLRHLTVKIHPTLTGSVSLAHTHCTAESHVCYCGNFFITRTWEIQRVSHCIVQLCMSCLRPNDVCHMGVQSSVLTPAWLLLWMPVSDVGATWRKHVKPFKALNTRTELQK